MTEFPNKDKALLKYLECNYQIKDDSPIYKAASILLQRLWQGSICVSINELKNEIPGFSETCFKGVPAVGRGNEVRPLIFDGGNLYIQKYRVYQSIILGKIEKLIKNGKFHIITGGPGTGKTTSLAEKLSKIIQKENKILLAAPTGKAAFRMNQALRNSMIHNEKKEHTHWVKNISKEIKEKLEKLEPKTIHRLLGSIYLSVNFKHNRDNPMEADIIAIDECSMIDIPLMAKLLDAVPDNCHLFLLGDKNQLSPIEAGTVFADICGKYDKNSDVIEKRSKNFRAESQDIIDFSNEILNETLISLQNITKNNIQYNKDFSLNYLYDKYSGLLNACNEENALNALQEFQILCSVKDGKNGTKNINKELSEKADKNDVRYTPIIITENNYTQNLFNGDVGVCDKEMAYFTGDNEIRKFPLSSLTGCDTAFAITIHKSQGSEYNSVAVIYPDSKIDGDRQTIWTKELFYTAVTRARKECAIYGSEELLIESCKNRIFRASGIK